MLVMEYMEYGSLSELLQNETMLLEGELLLPMLQDISRGCRFLHAADPKVIHGDLKSANILVDSKFRAKVADFGLSQKKRICGVTGTPYFMAPELLRQETLNTAQSDVYSFGIILYEVYSRRDPYEGEDFNTVLRAVADPDTNKRPPVPADCPPQMVAIMSDSLVAEPDQRPTFEELDKRLRRVELKSADSTSSSYFIEKRATVSLFDIFPKHIAEKLQDGENVEAEHHDLVTIFFCDIVGFTNISSTLEPRKIANLLDRLYKKFDSLSEKHDIFKVETIGDAYMAVTNLVKKQPDDHVKRIAEFAVDAVKEANDTLVDLEDQSRGYVDIRVGFHSGPVVSDVVGSRNPRYCLFGDAVNTAARMESTSVINKIMCSEISAGILKQQNCSYPVRSRGFIEVKGKGEMHTFWVNEGVGAVKSKRQLSIIQEPLSALTKVAFDLPEEAENGDCSAPVAVPTKLGWNRISADGSIASSQTGDSEGDSEASGGVADGQ
jgi:class 3 adenylate cyclase